LGEGTGAKKKEGCVEKGVIPEKIKVLPEQFGEVWASPGGGPHGRGKGGIANLG